MKVADIHSVYFIGIGGIGMSALARWFKANGKVVAGYDRVQTTLTQSLEREGIRIDYKDDIGLLPGWATDRDNGLVVYTPAIPKDHAQFSFLIDKGITPKKRSEVLGIITAQAHTIAVAGTHGKTTTSSMIAHLLSGSSAGCSAFVGGIMTNYDSNLIIGNSDAPVVVEADEFDRSFLRLHPNYSIVTSLDPDHLDIYGESTEMERSYMEFMGLTAKDGKLLVHEKVGKRIQKSIQRPVLTYGLDNAEITAANLSISGDRFVFDYAGSTEIAGIRLGLPGYHNVSNAIAAITVALDMGMEGEKIRERLESYRGVKRRFEYVIREKDLIYIDDYAHHPTEIEALLQSVRKLYPSKKITAVFQPHLFTRTRDFKEGFASSLDLADEIVLLDIYPARELPIEGVTSQSILDHMTSTNKKLLKKEDFPEVLKEINPEVLLTIGAGDIDTLVPRIRSYYLKQEEVEG